MLMAMSAGANGDHDSGAMSKDPRVLWVSTSKNGGIATFVRNMRETALWNNWNIRDVSTHRSGTALIRVGAFISGLVQFGAEMVFRRPDVVHLHTAAYGSFARKCLLTWICVVFRVPVVLHVHGSTFDEFYSHAPPLAQRLIRATLERADAVIALGSTWADRIQRMAPRAHVVIVANAIRPGARVPQTDVPLVHVVFLGEIGTRKGTFLLLEAWAKMLNRSTVGATKLTVAGDGDVGRARDLVTELGIGESVDVRGWISPVEVSQLLSEAQVLVLPSRNEGQPMAILEAMARGICVVASDVGGIPEMLGDAGVMLTKSGDADELVEALGYVIADHVARAQLGSRAWRRVESEFNVDLIEAQFDELYRRMLTNRSSKMRER